jgi:methyl-accepting chemotaxis protein
MDAGDVSKNLSADKQAVTDIGNTIKDVFKPIETLAEALGLMVAHADKLNKSFGLGRARIEEMKVAFTDAAAGVEKLGGSLDDVSNTIIAIASASNRNVIENEKVISELYAASKVLDTTAGALVNKFKDVGYETSQIGPNLNKSIEYIQSVGLNATKVMKDVSDNMGQMNRYQFEGGVQGLAKMAAQASMLRFDMKETFQFAEKVLTPEGAIETAAGIQRLGVSMGALADPFALMNASINDPSGLQDSLIKATKQFTEYDEKTKSFKINPQGVLTLRELAKETGTSFENLSKSALAAADLDKRLSEVSGAGLKFENEEDKQYLANIAKMGKGGKYEVTLKDGVTKELQNLNQEEFDELIEQQKNAPKTVEDIQRSQLTALQSMAADMKAMVSAGKFGAVSTKEVSTNIEGLRNIFTKFGDVSQKSFPKTPEVRKSVSEAIGEMKTLFGEAQKGGIKSEDFINNLKNIQASLLKKGESLGDDSLNAIKEVLKETASSLKGTSMVETWFKNNLLDGSKPTTTQTKSPTTAKPLTRDAVMGKGTASKNYVGSGSQSKQINSQVDIGGTITFKFDLPPGTTLNQKQLNDVFNSQDFKQYILNLNKSNNEGKNQGVVSYGK